MNIISVEFNTGFILEDLYYSPSVYRYLREPTETQVFVTYSNGNRERFLAKNDRCEYLSRRHKKQEEKVKEKVDIIYEHINSGESCVTNKTLRIRRPFYIRKIDLEPVCN